MTAPRGNKFWKLRSKHSRKSLFESPELLMRAASEYFEWCDKHTWFRQEAVKSGTGLGTIINVPVVRPYSISGLCAYLRCSQRYFNHFREKCGDGFREVVEYIENVIETQQFEGAATGAFNASVITRKMAVSDRQEPSPENQATLKIEIIAPAVKDELEKLRQNLGSGE